MTTAHAWGFVLNGVIGERVRIEVDIAQGLPSVGVIGLADTTIGESRWRIRSAFSNSGAQWPSARMTIALSPADLPKQGSGIDLAIAAAILAATEQAPVREEYAYIGELGLDGSVRGVRGAIAAAAAARRSGLTTVVVSSDNAREVSTIPGLTVIIVRDLVHLIEVLAGREHSAAMPEVVSPTAADPDPDLADVRGHAYAKFALEIAAVGGHHVSMLGAPGVGKTLLARRLPGLLPDLDDIDAIDVTTIHSLAGRLSAGDGLVTRPPLAAPHHSATPPSMTGTARGRQVTPGVLTMAHGGVLFMDEAPEFSRHVLEAMREPLETGSIMVTRAAGVIELPARFQLILASNPCPCGNAIGRGELCTCTSMTRRRYAERLSGPLMDRVDVRVVVTRPTEAEMISASVEESSPVVAARVVEARSRAAYRFKNCEWSVNSAIPTRALRDAYAPTSDAVEMLRRAEQGSLSLRGSDRVLRVAWSIADCLGADRPNVDHVSTALGLRGEMVSR
jgi:magnesium chelatase family protein